MITPAFWNSFKQCMGRESLDFDRESYVGETYDSGLAAAAKQKHFILAIDLTNSPSDGTVGGEVSFTGEHTRTSLATIQQKSCTLAGAIPRITMCVRYDAIVEVSAGGRDLLA